MTDKYIFLGSSDAALSMFVEILHDNLGPDINLTIVKNIEVVSKYPFLVEGMKAEILLHSSWVKPETANYFIGVNKSENKKAVFNFFNVEFDIGTNMYRQLIHKSSIVAATAKMGNGVVLNPGVILAPFVSIGDLVSLNRNVTIGHHTNIGAFTTIHPAVNIAGFCNIGSGVTIGMGSNIIDGITIGQNSVVGAGSLITKDIPDNVIAYGAPAKVIRKSK